MRFTKIFTVLLVAVICLGFVVLEVDAKKKEVKEAKIEDAKEKYTKEGNEDKKIKGDKKKEDKKKDKKNKDQDKKDKKAEKKAKKDDASVESDAELTSTEEIVAEPVVAEGEASEKEDKKAKKEKKDKAEEAPEEVAPDVLLAQALKLRRKILAAEAEPSKTSNQKVQRMRDTYADYQSQMRAAGIDFASEVTKEEEAHAHDTKIRDLEAEFYNAWREHQGLERRGPPPEGECGCQKKARLEREAAEAGTKVDKSQFSMRERIEYKMKGLENKLAEQKFRLEWFADQGVDMDAKPASGEATAVKDEL